MWPQSMRQFWVGKALINGRVNVYSRSAVSAPVQTGFFACTGYRAKFSSGRAGKCSATFRNYFWTRVGGKVSPSFGGRNLVEAFPNAFMGVLLPSDCFGHYQSCAEETNLNGSMMNAVSKTSLILS